MNEENNIRDRLEKENYPFVRSWAVDHFGCFDAFTDVGLKYGRIDVLGVRDVGGDFSGDIETISIEVKRGRTPFASACGQALSYRLYAHRVYLADIRENSFTSDEVYIASHLGIGLIRLSLDEQCFECLSSPYYQPINRFHLAVLETSGLGQCRFCQSFFTVGRKDNGRWISVLQRGDVNKPIQHALHKEKGLLFWTEASGVRKKKLDAKRSDKEGVWDRRFVCNDCLRTFFSEFQNTD